MIINLRTLDCLTNSPCQIHWKYIENSMEEMHINSGCKALSYFAMTSYYLNVHLHNMIIYNYRILTNCSYNV